MIDNLSEAKEVCRLPTLPTTWNTLFDNFFFFIFLSIPRKLSSVGIRYWGTADD
jgi:hypothetical protein